MGEYVRENYRVVVGELEGTGLEVFGLEAGYLVLVDFKGYGLEGKEVMRRLEERNIFLTSMKTFFVECEDTTLVRINIACNRKYLGRFLKRFKEVLKDMEGVKTIENV